MRLVAKPNRCLAAAHVPVLLGRRGPQAKRARKKLEAVLADASASAEDKAEARFFLAEQDFEAHLALRFPHGLDFSGKSAKRSEKRFLRVMGALQSSSRGLIKRYESVDSKREATVTARLAARQRVAEVSRHFAQALLFAEIPRDVRTGPYSVESRHAFCDALDDKARALVDLSRSSAEACATLAKEAGRATDLARCEALVAPLGTSEDPLNVRRIARKHQREFRKCLTSAGASASDQVQLAFDLISDGSVVTARARGTASEAARTCLEAKAKSVRFPALIGPAPLTVKHSWVHQP